MISKTVKFTFKLTEASDGKLSKDIDKIIKNELSKKKKLQLKPRKP